MREPLRLVLTAPPARLPVELGEMQAHLRLDDDQVLEDALVAGDLRAAVEACQAFTGRSLMTQTWTLNLDRWPGRAVLELPRPPLQAVVHVKTFDEDDAETLWPAANCLVDPAGEPGRLIARGDLALPPPGRSANGIEVRFVAGYGDAPGDVPEVLRLGILRFAAFLFENRGDDAAASALRDCGAAALWRPFIVARL